jgi:NADH dehydrogenase (ubiquinone) 1 beta subcomplex subunit 3
MNKVVFILFFFSRNEVWRYDPAFGSVPRRRLALRTIGTGMKLGAILALGTIALEVGYKSVFGSKDGHGHGHGHDDHGKGAHH